MTSSADIQPFDMILAPWLSDDPPCDILWMKVSRSLGLTVSHHLWDALFHIITRSRRVSAQKRHLAQLIGRHLGVLHPIAECLNVSLHSHPDSSVLQCVSWETAGCGLSGGGTSKWECSCSHSLSLSFCFPNIFYIKKDDRVQ